MNRGTGPPSRAFRRAGSPPRGSFSGRCGLPARVAQLVEQLICNQLVGGSSPFSGSRGGGSPGRKRGAAAPELKNGQVAKWPTATDCKSVLFGVRWFESILAHESNAPAGRGETLVGEAARVHTRK